MAHGLLTMSDGIVLPDRQLNFSGFPL